MCGGVLSCFVQLVRKIELIKVCMSSNIDFPCWIQTFISFMIITIPYENVFICVEIKLLTVVGSEIGKTRTTKGFHEGIVWLLVQQFL